MKNLRKDQIENSKYRQYAFSCFKFPKFSKYVGSIENRDMQNKPHFFTADLSISTLSI